MKKTISLLLCAVLLAALISGAILYTKKMDEKPIQDAGTAQHAAEKQETITYQGTDYPIRKHIQSVLLIGTDSTEQIIQLNRDTMTDVPWLDVLGKYGGTEYKQLCLAFNYGNGGASSCKNTWNAVSGLIFNAPIDHYIQVPMSAIGVVNDLVGGVPVTIADDLTAVDPAFVQRTTLRLKGAQAEKFLRARKSLVDDTNISRMRRQRDYRDSFQKCAKAAFHSDSEFALKLLEKMAEYLQSDLTAQQLSDLIVQLDNSLISPIRCAEGELIVDTQYYEFYVDKDSLWETVRSTYCE